MKLVKRLTFTVGASLIALSSINSAQAYPNLCSRVGGTSIGAPTNCADCHTGAPSASNYKGGCASLMPTPPNAGGGNMGGITPTPPNAGGGNMSGRGYRGDDNRSGRRHERDDDDRGRSRRSSRDDD